MSYEILQVTVPPVTTPVTLAVAKQHCRVDTSYTGDDNLISLYITAATATAESYLKRTLVNTTYKLTRDYLPTAIFNVPTGNSAFNIFLNSSVYPYTLESVFKVMKPPLVSVSSITYKDTAGNVNTLDPSLYIVSEGTPGRIAPAYGVVYPFTLPQIGAVTITYTAGYGFLEDGTTPNVPGNIQAAILLIVGHLYRNREAVTEGGMSVLPMGVKELLDTAAPGMYV
jgi:uncharacterized phiE125 gp8 family phage protein